jgi:hypothetical protein
MKGRRAGYVFLVLLMFALTASPVEASRGRSGDTVLLRVAKFAR